MNVCLAILKFLKIHGPYAWIRKSKPWEIHYGKLSKENYIKFEVLINHRDLHHGSRI